MHQSNGMKMKGDVFRGLQDLTCLIFAFIGENNDRKIKANTCDKEGGVKSGRCQVAQVLSFMKMLGHLKEPNAQEVLFLDTASELT